MKKLFMSLFSLLLAAAFCLSSATPAAASENPAEKLPYFVYFSSEKPFSSEQLVESRSEHFYEIEDGNLYKIEYESQGDCWDKISQLLIGNGRVTNYAVADNDLIFVMNDMIYRSNWNATDVNFVFALPESINGEIKTVLANDYLIWFQAGDSIYRLYRQNNALDFVYSNPDMLWWRPASNYSIEYAVYSEEYLQAKRDGRDPDSMSFNIEARYQYNALTNETALEYQEELGSEWQLTSVTASSNVYHYPSYSTTIAGKRIPESKYPIGSFISSNGQECGHHKTNWNGNCNIDGSCGCLKLGNKDGLGTGIQCVGFARQIYWDLFGTNKGTLSSNINVSAAPENFFMDLHPGAYIKTKTHAMIFIKATSTSADFYHANYEAPCQVSVSRFSYDVFKGDYSTLYEVYGQSHTYSTGVSSYDKQYHHYKCTGTNCSSKKKVLHSFVSSGNKKVCSVCGCSIFLSR